MKKGAFGKFPQLLPLALKKVVRDRNVTGEQMQKLLQVYASGTARYDEESHQLIVDFSMGRALTEGAAKARVNIRPIAGDKSFFKKTISTTANARSDTKTEVVLKLGRKASPPAALEAEVSWTFGSKRMKEVVSIPVE